MINYSFVQYRAVLSIVTLCLFQEHYSKSLICDDFRTIDISPMLSKVFEHCIIERYQSFLVSSDNQFGFKKRVGCSFSIKTVRSVVDCYVTKGSTVNLCAIDVSKAFDRVNNFVLLNKLRLLPVKLLSLLENWLLNCHSCQMGFLFCAVFKTIVWS